MGKRYEKRRSEVKENKKTLDSLRLDKDNLQNEYTPLSDILGNLGLFDDEVADSIQRVEDVGIAESERINAETDTAEQEKGEIAAEINQEIDKLNLGLDKLRKMENFNFGKKAIEKGTSEYKRQIGKFKELMGELGESIDEVDNSGLSGYTDSYSLKRDPMEQYEIGLRAIDEIVENYRENLRDRGVADGKEMEDFINRERIMMIEALSANIDGDLSKSHEEPDFDKIALDMPKTFALTNDDRAKIRAGIINGEIGENNIRELGKPVREKYSAIISERDNMLTNIQNERYNIMAQVNSVQNAEERNTFLRRADELRERENNIKSSFSHSETVKQALSMTRPVGPAENDSGQLYTNKNNIFVKSAIASINSARKNLPTDWVEKSNEIPIKAKHVSRGSFTQSNGVSNISLSSGRGMERCAYHELGHHFEAAFPEIRRLEHEFYNRRTAGENLQWLGVGYDESEKTRYDNFINPYMGKDYGNTEQSHYELLSVGLESLYSGSYDLSRDPEYQDFIFGILISI
jgi:hypothetical protein